MAGEIDPVLASLRRRSAGVGRVAALSTGFFLIPMFAAGLASGSLSMPSIAQQVASDLATIFGWRTENDAEYQAAFPLARDIWTIVMGLTAAATVTIVYAQWTLMERLFSDLSKKSVIGLVSRGEFQDWIEKSNTFFERRYAAFVALTLSSLTATLALREMYLNGVFPTIASAGGVPAREVYANWWASSENPVGAFTYAVLTVTYNYYIILQNIVGAMLIWLFIRQRKNLSLKYNLSKPDKYYGWLSVRRLLQTVYLSISVHALAIGCLFIIMPNYSLVSLPVVYGIFLGLNPLFIVVPLVVIVTKSHAAKVGMIEQEQSNHRRVIEDLATQRLSRIERDAELSAIESSHLLRLQQLEALPLAPFKAKEFVFGAATYVSLALSVIALTS